MLDASVALAWCFEDESSDMAESLESALKDGIAIVPPIWPAEVLNGLLYARRRGRITPQKLAAFVDELFNLKALVKFETSREDLVRVVDIAEHFELTAYDACYVELAQRFNFPLATLDRKLKRAAKESGVVLFESEVQ